MLLKFQISQYQAALAVSVMYPQQNLRLSQVVMKISKYLLDFTGMLMASKYNGDRLLKAAAQSSKLSLSLFRFRKFLPCLLHNTVIVAAMTPIPLPPPFQILLLH